MRKWATLFVGTILGLSHLTMGAVLTCSNRINSPGEYTDLQTAVDAASDGDTIYVHGSETEYGSVTIRKRITLIGPGYNPNKQSALPAQLNTISVEAESEQLDASASHFMGLDFKAIEGPTVNNAVKRVADIMIERCRIQSTIRPRHSENWTVKHNYILASFYCETSTDQQCDGLLVMNNIITGGLHSWQTNTRNIPVDGTLSVKLKARTND